jgi:cobalt-zinc-cadmium efflux system membrane fusion protein
MSSPLQNTKETLMRSLINMLAILSLAAPLISFGEEGLEEDGHKEAAGTLEFDISEQESAGIVTEKLNLHSLSEIITVPAEVTLNAYRTSKVSPRITAQIVERHARLGDAVKSGKSLVTLSSVDMAEAQGALIIATREWQRVKKLGKGAVSEKRHTEAQVLQQQALARVLAYGMGKDHALELMDSSDATLATGEFDLLAAQAGTVLQDDFIVGELVEPGRVLFTISDESTLWVEAKTFSSQLKSISVGDAASVSVNSLDWIDGSVIQIHHRLDETTRTQGLRIQIHNENDSLHPGEFAEAQITTGLSNPVISVPNEAITMINGVPTVFLLEAGHEFHPVGIETSNTIGTRTIVIKGLSSGDTVATAGVFYLKSMMLKSTLGEGH